MATVQGAMRARLTLIRPDWLAIEVDGATEENREIVTRALTAAWQAAGEMANPQGPFCLNGDVWAGMVCGGDGRRARAAAADVLEAASAQTKQA